MAAGGEPAAGSKPAAGAKPGTGTVRVAGHPHELWYCLPRKSCCALSSGKAVCCGCNDVIHQRAARYECRHKPKPCDYRICAACVNLGPGEGGMIQTASFHDAEDEAPPAKAHSSSLQTEFPVKPLGEPLAPTPSPSAASAPGNLPPRLAAAGMDFGLEADGEAQEAWERFAVQGAGGGAPWGKGDPALLKAAQDAAPHLHFLELTVLSQSALIAEQDSRLKARCLELYSPLAGIPAHVKNELLELAKQVPYVERAMGSLVGMAVGDALGAPFEFLDAVDVEGSSGSAFSLKKFKGYGGKNKFKVSPGQWTDDASMGLCLADSLLARGYYDGSDARVRFHNWWFRGYNNAFGNDSRIGSVGLGSNVAKSLRAMAPGKKPSARYEAQNQDAGNGTIMRLAAVPIFYAKDPAEAARKSAASSEATHPGPIAAAAAAFLGFAIAKALQRSGEQTARAFLDSVVADFRKEGLPGAKACPELERLLRSEEPRGSKEECWNWRGRKLQVESSLLSRGDYYNGYLCTANYFGSYCMDGLAVALWCFYNTTGFAEAIVRCTNFLGDADTTSAICGQLAGAFYGYSAIDQRWITSLECWDNSETACRAVLLCVKSAQA